ncbi:MAG: hypothetical protein JST61_11360 [Acidobacteria bacterium]|nr:hypothetical protein [Acidobacteriota bacterium]
MIDPQNSAEAARRALDALLRNARPRSVMLRTPAPAMAGDNTEQLGLATPQFQDIELAPAVFRKGPGRAAKDGTLQRELLLSATAVEALTGSGGFAAANALFATAFGVLVDNTLLAIAAFEEIEAGGSVCGYRLTLSEAAASA